MGQDPSLDRGATEMRLREWLSKSVGAFEARARELEAEERRGAAEESELAVLRERVAELEAELTAGRKVAGVDAGSARARSMIERILAEVHE